jgi:5-methylcytosine-specific restriction endonuclease McrA
VDITRTRAFQRWRQKRQESRQLYVSRYLKRWHSLSSAESKRLVPPRREVASTASQRIRAAAYASPVNDLKPEEWAWLQEAYQGCCAYCGESCTNLTPDHVIPLSRGGANTLSNIVPACPACNNRKNARTPAEAGMLPIINIDLSTKLQQLSLF